MQIGFIFQTDNSEELEAQIIGLGTFKLNPKKEEMKLINNHYNNIYHHDSIVYYEMEKKRLQEIIEQFTFVLNIISQGICICDCFGKIIYMNQYFFQFFFNEQEYNSTSSGNTTNQEQRHKIINSNFFNEICEKNKLFSNFIQSNQINNTFKFSNMTIFHPITKKPIRQVNIQCSKHYSSISRNFFFINIIENPKNQVHYIQPSTNYNFLYKFKQSVFFK